MYIYPEEGTTSRDVLEFNAKKIQRKRNISLIYLEMIERFIAREKNHGNLNMFKEVVLDIWQGYKNNNLILVKTF